jgi:ferritin-like metal-binding protein YciE
LRKALPEMIEKATDAGLKQGFETHLGETKNHVKRPERVFKMHGSTQRESSARQSMGSSKKPMTSPAM